MSEERDVETVPTCCYDINTGEAVIKQLPAGADMPRGFVDSPAKCKGSDADETDEADEADEASPVKRGPGRPRKNPA